MTHRTLSNMKYYVDFKEDTDNSYRLKVSMKSESGYLNHFIINVVPEFSVDDDKILKVDDIDYRFFDDILLTAEQLKVLAVEVFNNESKLIEYILLQEKITTAFSDRDHLVIL